MDWLKDSKGNLLVVLSTSEHKNQWLKWPFPALTTEKNQMNNQRRELLNKPPSTFFLPSSIYFPRRSAGYEFAANETQMSS